VLWSAGLVVAALLAVGIAVATWRVVASRWGAGCATAAGPRTVPSVVTPGSDLPVDPVLVLDIAGAGRDSALGPAVTEAVRTALAQVQSVTVLSPDYIGEVLRRMQRPENTPVDLPIAREIAQREGVKVIVDGKLLTLGGQYVLSLRLIAPSTGQELSRFRETANGEAELLSAIDRATKGVRTALGESVRRVQASVPLAQVTTPSIDALRKYVEAFRVVDVDVERGLRLFREATTIDTGFAMAFRRMAVVYDNLGLADEANRAIERAFALRERLGEAERLMVEGTYYGTGRHVDTAASRGAYERLVLIQPNNFVAVNNLAINYMGLRRFADAERLLWHANRVNPYIKYPFTNLLETAANTSGAAGVRRVIDAYRRAAPTVPELPRDEAEALWALGDFDSAQTRLAELRRRPRDPFMRVDDLRASAGIEGARGRLQESRRLYREAGLLSERTGQPLTVLGGEARSAYVQATWLGDSATAKRWLDDGVRQRLPATNDISQAQTLRVLVRAYAAAGSPARARELFTRWEQSQAALVVKDDASRWAMTAEIAEAEGRLDDALTAWRAGDIGACTFCVWVGIGRVYDRQQRADSAITAYERYLAIPDFIFRTDLDALHLAPVHQRLAALYEATGDTAKVLAHLRTFVALWKAADPELQPLVAAARGAIARLERASDGRAGR